MIKRTFRELNNYNDVVRALMAKRPEIMDGKFGYAIKRFEQVNEDLFKGYGIELNEARVEHALVDKTTGALLKDSMDPRNARGYLYDKEGMKAVIKAEHEIEARWMKKEMEVEPYIVKEKNIPKDLTEEEKQVFSGILIEPIKEDEEDGTVSTPEKTTSKKA